MPRRHTLLKPLMLVKLETILKFALLKLETILRFERRRDAVSIF